MAILRRSLLLAVAALVAWRILTLGVSSHYADQLAQGRVDAAAKALAWSGRQPEALFRQALSTREQDPDRAWTLLARAFAENPADARPLIALANLAQQQGDQTEADALVKAAVGLMPSDPSIQLQAAGFWAFKGDLEAALHHSSTALEADPAARDQVFPVLLSIAEDPRARLALKPIALAPPSWWEPFFEEVSRRALDEETVRLLYAWRRESPQSPISPRERETLVSRLTKDGNITTAYVEWVNGLSRARRVRLGLIHDGGFELDPTNSGFDWHLRSTPNAIVDRARTFGVDGEKGLHVLFKGQERRFAEVYQPLYLDPGRYRLSGRVRTDSLETQGGLKWTLRCLQPEAKDLGESERFLGSNQWRDFGFEFDIPPDCRLQEIRLLSAGKRDFEHKITGGAWFDRIAIVKIAGSGNTVDTDRKDSLNAPTGPPDSAAPTTE